MTPNQNQQQNAVQTSIALSIPIMPTNAYPMRRIDGRLDPKQAETCTALLEALRQQRATLKDGHHVSRPLDVFRWLMERIGDEFAKPRQAAPSRGR